ncbi:hypothetical protein Glove_284g28 [Diversispora epigaea]|uniref:Uncharacterized protein n=1 Tax=Diversispora epigaea TaxID=1348612 RepID=A0A397I937_9GLOM|nr:hypothetical protein Glove_284g28 [Diversispora epigaea]
MYNTTALSSHFYTISSSHFHAISSSPTSSSSPAPGLQEYYYEGNQDDSIEVPLETHEIPIEPFDLESIHLTENTDSEPFDDGDGPLYPVVSEMSFDNWTNIDNWLKNHGLEQGFTFTITHSKKDKNDEIP